jgi:hypothetical protein
MSQIERLSFIDGRIKTKANLQSSKARSAWISASVSL